MNVNVKQRLAEIKAIMAKADYSESDSQELINIRTSDCPLWGKLHRVKPKARASGIV